MVEFFEEQSILHNNSTRKPTLIVGGMLFYVPRRVSNWAYHSSPIVQGEIQLVGVRNYGKGFRESLKAIVRPFLPITWIGIFLFLVFLLIIKVWLGNLRWSRCRGTKIVRHIFGEEFEANASETIEDSETFHTLNRVWYVAVCLFYTIVFLFYEVGLLYNSSA